jgi:hypothetical protein
VVHYLDVQQELHLLPQTRKLFPSLQALQKASQHPSGDE